jgi:hypothetical protein
MLDLSKLGPHIKSVHGLLTEVGRDQTTEVLDLYRPLLSIKNQNSVWLGLNLIFPYEKKLRIPLISHIKCYIATFHGDPIDLKWINSTASILQNFDQRLANNFIVCSNYPKPKQLPEFIKYFQVEHLNLLPRWYDNSSLHLARSSKSRQFNFSYLSNRVTWFRTALFAYLFKLEKAILSFPNTPDLKDLNLIDFLSENNSLWLLDELAEFLPLPLDNYYESICDLQNGWTVNNIAYQNCLINVVNESTLDYDGHMSEKSFKPLISKTLPVYSSLKQIARLTDFGFKFNTSFYDNSPHPIMRQVNTLKNLLNLSNVELINLVNEFSDHNRDWFFNGFHDKVNVDNQIVLNQLVEHVKHIVD